MKSNRLRVRLNLERFEERWMPSTSILLNQVDPITQVPNTPDWTAIGPGPQSQTGLSTIGTSTTSGRISGIAIDPTNPNRIFVTAASGGVWRTLDDGAHWTPLTDHLPSNTPTTPPTNPTTFIKDSQRTLNMGAIAIAPSNPNVIYAAEGEADAGTTGFGVLVSKDGGDTWTLTGTDVFFNPTLPIGNAISSHSIVVDNLDPNIAFVAVNTPDFPIPPFGPPAGIGGIYRTLDGGQHWENITASASVFLPDAASALGLVTAFSDVDLAPRQSLSQPLVLYAAAGDQSGDPRNGIYRSLNATNTVASTVTWNLLFGGSAQIPGGGGNIQMSLAPSQPSTIYASIADKANPVNGDEVLLTVEKTTDGGVNWTRLGTPPNFVANYLGTQGGYDNVVQVSPTNPNEVIFAGQSSGGFQGVQNLGGILLSTDGGATFTDINTAGSAANGNQTSPHTDDHAGVFDSNGDFLLGCDGGLFEYTFGATLATSAWVSLNGTSTSNPTITALDTIQFYSVAIHPTSADLAMGGSQDNGTARFSNNVGWTQTDGGDGERVIYNFDNPQHVVHVIPLASGGVANYIEISNDGGLTWRPWSGSTIGNLTVNGATISPSTMIIDPSNSNRFFIGTDEISISEDGADHWGTTYTFAAGATQNVPSDPSSNIPPAMGGPFPITALGVGRSGAIFSTPVLYAAHTDGSLYQLFLFPPPSPAPSTMSWINIAPPTLTAPISKIIVDPQNSNNVYVLAGGNVFLTQNANATILGSFPTWTDITGDLPASFIGSSMVLDPKNFSDPTDDVVYVAGNTGQVYSLTNPAATGTPSWNRVGNPYDKTTGKGMPDVDITDLQLNTTTGILAAGTYGRGMWEIQVRGLIRGEVFTDANGNGKLDAGETGLAGVTVRLVNADNGLEIATATSDTNGIYVFRSLTASQLTATNYVVVESTPAGEIQTTAPLQFKNLTEQSTYDIADPNLNPVQVVIGNFTAGSISGTKFDDQNDNGQRDTGEPGAGGFQIFIDAKNTGVFDPAVDPVVTTQANGSFTFGNVGPAVVNGVPNPLTVNGAYIIREVPQTGWVQTSTLLPPVTVNSAQAVTGLLIGNIRTASISGTKFIDANGDGVREPGEPGGAGFTIQLSGPVGTRTVTTAADGSYTFFSLAPGNYTVTEIKPAGYTQTTVNPGTITLGLTDKRAGVDFGNFKNVSLGGTKFNDINGNGTFDKNEPGLSGFTFDLVNASTGQVVTKTTSGSTGTFTFANVGPMTGGGQYLIREEGQTGWVQTTPNPSPFSPSSGTNQTSFQFGNFQTYSVSGTAYIDRNKDGTQDNGETGAGGFVIQVRNAGGVVVAQTTTSATDGTFTVTGVGPGPVTVVEAPRSGFSLTEGISGYPITGTSGTNVSGLAFGNVSHSVTVAAADAGGPPLVVVRDTTTQQALLSFSAYNPAFGGGVRVATGYLSGPQSAPDIVTAPGPGGGPNIKVFDGTTGATIASFMAYAPNFTGGVYVAVGDVNGDGVPDIITGADAGGGPHVKVFDGASLLKGQVVVLDSFFAFAPTFTGGVRVASADVDKDGFADIIAAAGPGGGPQVKVISGKTLFPIRNFYAYSAAFTGGVYVAAGDVNGDGVPDIVTGPGVGGGPHLRVFNGATNGAILNEGFAFPPVSGGGGQIQNNNVWASGLRVATVTNDQGLANILVSPGQGQPPRFKLLDGRTLTDLLSAGIETVFDPSFLGGVFVAGT
jgi:hypothetical protein